MRAIVFLLMTALVACSADDAPGPRTKKMAPKSEAQTSYETVTTETPTSTEDINRDLAEHRAKQLAFEAEMEKAQEQAVSEIVVEGHSSVPIEDQIDRDDELPNWSAPPSSPAQFQWADSDAAYSSNQPQERNRNSRQKQPQTGSQSNQAKPLVAGARLFPPRPKPPTSSPNLQNVLPPGRFFHARLVNNVEASFFRPIVFAEIQTANGQVIGTAIGQANLHGLVKRRALLTFNRLELNDGTVLTGALHAFDLDRGQGLRGRVQRRTLLQIASAAAEAILGALSLNIDSGDGFAGLFQVNLANSLIRQAQGRLSELDSQRTIFIERDTRFLVASITDTTASQRGVNQDLLDVTSSVREAFNATADQQAQGFAGARANELMQLYQQLESSMARLPMAPPGEQP